MMSLKPMKPCTSTMGYLVWAVVDAAVAAWADDIGNQAVAAASVMAADDRAAESDLCMGSPPWAVDDENKWPLHLLWSGTNFHQALTARVSGITRPPNEGAGESLR